MRHRPPLFRRRPGDAAGDQDTESVAGIANEMRWCVCVCVVLGKDNAAEGAEKSVPIMDRGCHRWNF